MMKPVPQEIIDFYTNAYDEAERLSRGLGLLECIRMRELIIRYIPPPPAVVCDVGGGTGAHSFWLAGLGYQTHLVDIVPVHIERAKQIANRPDSPQLANLRVGDARKLDYTDHSADVVLLLGPLYHLTERNDRLAALTEAKRVLRPGGVLIASAICRYASTIAGLARGFVWDTDYQDMIDEELASGQHRKPTNWKVLTTAYFHHPDDLKTELAEAGMQHEVTLGVQGPVWMVPEFEESMSDAARQNVLLRIARMMEQEPVLSPHMLAIARRAN